MTRCGDSYGEVGIVRIGYLAPSPRWAAAVSVFGHFASTPATPAVHRMPALLPNLHIRLNGTSSYRFGDAAAVAAARVTLVGPTSAAFEMTMSHDFEMICVGFLPTGWSGLFGMPAAMLVDRAVDAADLWPPAVVDRLWHAVAAARSFGDRCGIVEAILDDAAARQEPTGTRQVAAVVDWL